MQIGSTREFSNIYLFVSDALRYDSVPDAVANGNQVIKTVSSSGVSCAAFSTLVSGLYPPQHGVWTFSDLIPESMTTFYDLFSGTCPSHLVVFSIVDAVESAVHYNDPNEFEDSLRGLSEPFFVLDRELATHAVYGQTSGPRDADQEFGDTDDYWRDRGADLNAICEDYARGVEVAAEKFAERLDVLEEAGHLEDTLVIFTADHGEALGEHGMVGHTNVPLAPEIVYVPTIFYNNEVTVNGDFIGHVDLLPTAASLVGKSVSGTRPGYDLTDGAPDERMLFNADKRRGGHVFGAWGREGGHTFSTVPYHLRFARAAERLTINSRARMHRQRAGTISALLFRQNRTFGSPWFDRESAREFCDNVFASSVTSRSGELGEDARGRLQALGYAENDIE